MKQQFQEMKLRAATLSTIETANAIIEEYDRQGFHLTLRQLYYQFVARGLIPNTERSYKALGEVISNGRMAGLIDWSAIEDRTRSLRGLTHWRDPQQIIGACVHSFRLDHWQNQPNRVEVWVEKDALIGVIEDVCEDLDVDYFACRGYTSQSEMHAAAKRLATYMRGGQDVTIIHLGDHDPSGIDMTRDIRDRLELFTGGLCGRYCEVNRVALTFTQVSQYDPPPNPAKATDARFADYQEVYGDESWELDALEPSVIADLIRTEVEDLRDETKLAETQEAEKEQKGLLERVSTDWQSIVRSLNGHGG